MADEGKVRITDGSTNVDLEPVLLFEVMHREDFSFRDINGNVRAKDVQTDGKIRQLNLELPIGGVTRSQWTQLNTWMTGGTQVKVQDYASGSTYAYNSSTYFWGRILSLDSGAYSEAKMTDPAYSVVIDVDRFATS
jgi:hypothetical protein